MTHSLTAILTREDDGFVALCPELDIASQDESIGVARANLRDAIKLFLKTASQQEIASRLGGEVYITQIKGAVVTS